MTARIRIAVAVAILFALAAHPAVHPLVKECPCLHEVATAASERADSVILAVQAEELPLSVDRLIESDGRHTLPPRAPPAS